MFEIGQIVLTTPSRPTLAEPILMPLKQQVPMCKNVLRLLRKRTLVAYR